MHHQSESDGWLGPALRGAPSELTCRVGMLGARHPRSTPGTQVRVIPIALILASATCIGCGQESEGSLAPTPQQVRLERRLYSGAPPVIPHDPLGAACTACHTETGREVPGVGIAPANPHRSTDNAAATVNCRQCHVFSQTDGRFAETTFVGFAPRSVHGDRLYAGAPPVVPHQLFMRENCAACHMGPAARPEIRCTHPDRINCRQCHIQKLPSS